MRVIAGRWKGRVLKGPTSRSVRPINDKVRGALFNIAGDLTGKTVLDVYSGTGAVALESLSRGALLVEAIESSRPAAKVIEANAKIVGAGERLDLIICEVEKWLDWPINPPEPRYDLIVADPPYASLDPKVLSRLAQFLKPHGVLAVSHAGKLEPPKLAGLELIQSKRYGDSALSFYKTL